MIWLRRVPNAGGCMKWALVHRKRSTRTSFAYSAQAIPNISLITSH